MKRLRTALALDEDVLDSIDTHGLETIDTNPFYLYVFMFHLYLYAFCWSVISRNMEGLLYKFYNGLYDSSFKGFIQLFW